MSVLTAPAAPKTSPQFVYKPSPPPPPQTAAVASAASAAATAAATATVAPKSQGMVPNVISCDAQALH